MDNEEIEYKISNQNMFVESLINRISILRASKRGLQDYLIEIISDIKQGKEFTQEEYSSILNTIEKW